MLFNKNNKNDEDLERIYEKVDSLSEDIGVLAKNMVSLSITVNKALGELNKQLPQFADTIVSELNNNIEEILLTPASDCCSVADVADVDKDDYVLQVYQKLTKNETMSRVYKPYNLYFDGYNFINRIGVNRGKISFTINDINTIKNNLGSVCETIVDDGFKYHSIYHNFHVSRNVFPKLLFNIIEGTFNDIERFKENPIKK